MTSSSVPASPVALATVSLPSGSGSWELVDTSVETEHMLNNQPRGVGLEYRVIAVNRAGSGKPSATVTVVL